MIKDIDNTLIHLVKTYSPTGKEKQAISIFNSYLKKLGATNVITDRAGNGLGIFAGEGLSITLCGHIDTVPGKLPVMVKNGVLYGRGSVDAKSSLVSLLYGAIIAKEAGFKGTLTVIAATGEEGMGKGILEVTRTQPKSDYAIFGEPGNVDGITVGYRGRLLLDVMFETEPFHASAPWIGGGSVDAAMTAWSKIRDHYSGRTGFYEVSVAMTGIHGGRSDNVIPSKTTITLDIRFPMPVDKNDILKEVLGICESLNLPVQVKIRIISEVKPYVSNTKSPLAKAFRFAIGQKTGANARLVFKSGSGDMNVLGNSWNIPAITYGPGNTQLSHTNNEFIRLEDVEKSAEIVSEALISLERELKY